MSRSSRFAWLPSGRIDVSIAILGLIVALALLPLGFLTTEILVEGIPLAIGIGCVFYLVSVRNSDRLPQSTDRLYPVQSVTLPGLWVGLPLAVLGLAFMTLVAVYTGGRSIAFLGLTALVGSLLLAYIAFVEENRLDPALVLAVVVGYAILIRFAGLFTTPGFIGIDTWTHVTTYAAAIQDANSLSAIAGIKYVTAPFYHLITVAASDLLGLSLRHALYLTIGVAMPLSTVAVYAAVRYVASVRWALFAAVLFAVSEYVVQWGLVVSTTSLGFVFFLVVFLFLVRVLYTGGTGIEYGVLFVFASAVTLSHQISAFVTATVLGVTTVTVVVMSRFVQQPTVGTEDGWSTSRSLGAITVLYVAGTAAIWAITPWRGERFLFRGVGLLGRWISTRVGFLNTVDRSGRGVTEASATAIPAEIVSLVGNLGLLLFLLVTVVGCLVLLQRDRLPRATALIGTFSVIVFVALGLPLFGFNFFNPGRWLAFMTAPMAIISVLGIGHLMRHLTPRTAIACVLVFALVFPGAMVVAEKATVDQPTFEQHWPQYAYDQQELDAVETLQRTVPETIIYTDHPYFTVFERRGEAVANLRSPAGADRSTLLPLTEAGVSDSDFSPAVYRPYQSSGRPIFSALGSGSVSMQVSSDAICPADRNHVYASGGIRMCTTPAS